MPDIDVKVVLNKMGIPAAVTGNKDIKWNERKSNITLSQEYNHNKRPIQITVQCPKLHAHEWHFWINHPGKKLNNHNIGKGFLTNQIG